MSLYADDLLVYMSDPGTSLPPMLSLLAQFSLFSGYKLNLHKSEFFPLGRGEMPESIHRNLPFQIVRDKFKYLGIVITKKHKDIFKENFVTMLAQVKQYLSQWSPLSTTLIGRINSI